MTEQRRVCAVEVCDLPPKTAGYCPKHYAKLTRYGDPLGGYYSEGTPFERTVARLVENDEGCWLATGRLSKQGYVEVTAGRGLERTMRGGHTIMYEAMVGPVPSGMQLDHLCHTFDPLCVGGPSCPHRACCNPAHMEPVTPLENTRRSRSPSVLIAQSGRCSRGHERAVYGRVRPDGFGVECKECTRARDRERVQRGSLQVPESAHGTLTGYNYYRCRCPGCREASSRRQRSRKAGA